MARMRELLKLYRTEAVLMGIILASTSLPFIDIYLVVGDQWQGIPPTFTDENFNYARVQPIVEGYAKGGHPYFFEHRNDPPLVIFAGAWINALPQLAGLSFNASLILNFILWSLLFAAALYWLFRELRVPPWISVCGTVLIYIQSYAHVWRPVNLQPVYPFYFLFYIALLRLIREQSKRNILFAAIITGAMFYLFAYMWQTIVITLGLLFLYALVRKNWQLLKAVSFASVLGGIIGLPVPLYALWLSHASPYFWESVGRLGLVNTHLPMAETIYSGGWIGVLLVLLAVLFWRVRVLRGDWHFLQLGTFLSVSGFGLWVMQGSNLFTGKLLETAEHVRLLILPWLIFASFSIAVFLWNRRAELSGILRAFSIFILIILSVVNLRYTYDYFSPFLFSHINREAWQEQQLLAKPFAWLQNEEKNPVVVWSNPYNDISINIPIYTKHFVLYTYFGMLELVPEAEIRERYLVSEYFNNPTAQDLRGLDKMLLYLGRRDLPHQAKTIEREIKVCRILFFWDKNHDCGIIPTPQSLLGDQFFIDLENKFKTEIKPNIKTYLEKYHVSYILKDKILDQKYRPEALGAVRVYSDDRYEIYKI